jgi:hypothetical protein
MALLHSEWQAYQRNEELHAHNEIMGVIQRSEETPPLNEKVLDSLYHSTLSEYARNAKRVLVCLS